MFLWKKLLPLSNGIVLEVWEHSLVVCLSPIMRLEEKHVSYTTKPICCVSKLAFFQKMNLAVPVTLPIPNTFLLVLILSLSHCSFCCRRTCSPSWTCLLPPNPHLFPACRSGVPRKAVLHFAQGWAFANSATVAGLVCKQWPDGRFCCSAFPSAAPEQDNVLGCLSSLHYSSYQLCLFSSLPHSSQDVCDGGYIRAFW